MQSNCQIQEKSKESRDLCHGNRNIDRILGIHGGDSPELPLPRHRTMLPSLRLRLGSGEMNLAISITGVGATAGFTTLMVNAIPDYQLYFNGQNFPLYAFEGVSGG